MDLSNNVRPSLIVSVGNVCVPSLRSGLFASAPQLGEELPDAAEVSGRVNVEGVPMPALELHKRLGLPGRIEQAASVRQRDHLVSRRMQKELRDSDAGHFVEGAETSDLRRARELLRALQ